MSGMQAADYDRMKSLAIKIKRQLKVMESGLTSLEAARKDMTECWTGFAGGYYNNALFWAMDYMKRSVEDMQDRADELERAGSRHELADIEAYKVAMSIEPATWAEV